MAYNPQIFLFGLSGNMIPVLYDTPTGGYDPNWSLICSNPGKGISCLVITNAGMSWYLEIVDTEYLQTSFLVGYKSRERFFLFSN
ncbi:hypothetical protein Trydic_g16870 [Trypoxylus dichotomus]